MSDPLVSVVMPALNAASFVGVAVSSILTQSYRNIELICIDDGSTDATADIIARYASRDRRVKLHRRANRGLVATLNEGLDHATGAFVARMDADDIAYEHRIERQVRFLADHPFIDLLGTHVDYLFRGGRVVRKGAPAVCSEEVVVEGMFHCLFIHPSVMFRRLSPDSASWRYDAAYPYCEDFELWSRMLRSNHAAILPSPELAWRQGHASVRSTSLRQMTLDALGVVSDNLRHRQVRADVDCLRPFLDIERPLIADDCRRAKSSLAELRAARSSFGDVAAAFDRGVNALLVNTLRAAAAAGRTRQLFACLPSDLRRGLPLSERVKAGILSALPASQGRLVVSQAQSLSRRLSSIPVGSLREVSGSVAALLKEPG